MTSYKPSRLVSTTDSWILITPRGLIYLSIISCPLTMVPGILSQCPRIFTTIDTPLKVPTSLDRTIRSIPLSSVPATTSSIGSTYTIEMVITSSYPCKSAYLRTERFTLTLMSLNTRLCWIMSTGYIALTTITTCNHKNMVRSSFLPSQSESSQTRIVEICIMTWLTILRTTESSSLDITKKTSCSSVLTQIPTATSPTRTQNTIPTSVLKTNTTPLSTIFRCWYGTSTPSSITVQKTATNLSATIMSGAATPIVR